MLEAKSATQNVDVEIVNQCGGCVYIPCMMHEQLMLGMIDTGSNKTIIKNSVFDKLKGLKLDTCTARLATATGMPINVMGEIKNLQLVVNGKSCPTTALVCDITEDLIIGNNFLEQHGIVIDYGNLTFTGKGFTTPLYQTSRTEQKGDVVSLVDKVIGSDAILACAIRGEDLSYPQTYIYQPNRAIWGEAAQPMVVNVLDEILELKIQNLNDRNMQLWLKKGEIIGTITEVNPGEMKRELETWNMTPEQRVEIIKKQTKIMDNENITEEEKGNVVNLLREFHDIFSLSKREISFTNVYKHKIQLTTPEAIQTAHRPLPIHQVEKVTEMITEMEEMGILEKCNSQYRSPVLLVNKKGGGSDNKRLVIDYRILNSFSENILYPMPTIEETRAVCGRGNYFSTFDLKSAYHQIPLEEESRDCTAIWVAGLGCYRYKVVPMGHKQSAGALQSLTDSIFRHLKNKILCSYLDDILVPSATVDEGISRLRAMFERIRYANIKIQATKSQLFEKSVNFLGVKLTKEGLLADAYKIADLLKIKTPESKKALQHFLGLAGYFRNFIKDYAEIAFPLTDCLKGEKFVFTEEAEDSFQKLKTALSTPPCLAWPDKNKIFKLYCDSSAHTIGGILVQGEKGSEQPICFGSKRLNESQMRYATWQRELLAIYYFCSRFRYYFQGAEYFQIYSDHKGLCFSKFIKKTCINTVLRWCLELTELNFEIFYIKGKDNVSDAMTRCETMNSKDLYTHYRKLFYGDNEETVNAVIDSDQMQHKKSVLLDSPHLLEKQDKDENIQRVKEWITKDNKESHPSRLPINLRIYHANRDQLLFNDQGILCKKHFFKKTQEERELICIPESMEEELIKMFHEIVCQHLGYDKTIDQIMGKYWMPDLRMKVRIFCGNCKECYKTNLLHQKRPIPPLKKFVYNYPNVAVNMDVIMISKAGLTQRECKIFCVMDRFSKMIHITAIKDEKGETIARAFLNGWVRQHGCPSEIISDNGPAFISNVMKNVCLMAGIDQKFITPYMASSNGQAERGQRIILDMLRKVVGEEPELWPRKLGLIEMAYNGCVNKSTGYSPHQIMTGRPFNSFDTLIMGSFNRKYFDTKGEFIYDTYHSLSKIFKLVGKNLESYYEVTKRVYDKGKSAPKLEEGDRVVLIKPKDKTRDFYKLESAFKGPYVIVEKYNEHNYKIQDIVTKKEFVEHRVHLRKIPDGIKWKDTDPTTEETHEDSQLYFKRATDHSPTDLELAEEETFWMEQTPERTIDPNQWNELRRRNREEMRRTSLTYHEAEEQSQRGDSNNEEDIIRDINGEQDHQSDSDQEESENEIEEEEEEDDQEDPAEGHESEEESNGEMNEDSLSDVDLDQLDTLQQEEQGIYRTRSGRQVKRPDRYGSTDNN